MASKTVQQQGIRLVKDLLYARRNRNITKEQVAYDKLWAFCQRHNLDFSLCIEDVKQYLRRNDVAAIMNGLV